MIIQIDTRLTRLINENPKILNTFSVCLTKAKMIKEAKSFEIFLNWSTFLEYVQLGSLFESLPIFGPTNAIFELAISTLNLETNEELICHLYDQLFIECLTQVQSLPQIQSAFLIEKIHSKRQSISDKLEKKLLAKSLDHFEKSLIENAHSSIHDLTLYLAWERMCTYAVTLFEQITTNQNFEAGLDIIRKCLMESFYHISLQKKTKPSFFILVEAIYAYQMRDVNLNKHSEEEWLILCQGSKALKPIGELISIPYIDGVNSSNDPCVWTLDSSEQIQAGLSLANYVNKLMRKEFKGWQHGMPSAKISTFKENDEKSTVAALLKPILYT